MEKQGFKPNEKVRLIQPDMIVETSDQSFTVCEMKDGSKITFPTALLRLRDAKIWIGTGLLDDEDD